MRSIPLWLTLALAAPHTSEAALPRDNARSAAPAGARSIDHHLQPPGNLGELESFSDESRLAAYAPGLEDAHDAAAQPADGSSATAERVQAVDAAPIESTSGAAPVREQAPRVPGLGVTGPVKTYADDDPNAGGDTPPDDPQPQPPPDDGGGGGAGNPAAVGGAAVLGCLFAAIGFLLGGPIGACIGFLVGALIGALLGGLFG